MNTHRTIFTALVATLVVFGAMAFSTEAQESEAPAKAPPPVKKAPTNPVQVAANGEFVNMSDEDVLKAVRNKELDQCIEASLKTLAGYQKANGAFGRQNVITATTALAGMAFLASGSLPDSGPYAKNIRNARDFLLENQDPNTGFINEANDSTSRIHGHGYALMFLASLVGHSDPKMEKTLNKAVSLACKCLINGQTPDGGWGYYPNKLDFDEGSTTVCCLQGIRAARNAGINVDKTVISNAIDYINKTKEKLSFRSPRKGFKNKTMEGYTFKYSLASPISMQSWSLAAVSCSSLNNIGIYSGIGSWDKQGLTRVLHGAVRWLWHHSDDFFDRVRANESSLDTSHMPYSAFYATQTFWQYNNRSYFLDFFPKLRDFYLERWRGSHKKGFTGSNYGPAYATAFALLSLQLPFQYLPAYQR